MSLKVVPLSRAFSSAIFRIRGASRGPSESGEVLVLCKLVSVNAIE